MRKARFLFWFLFVYSMTVIFEYLKCYLVKWDFPIHPLCLDPLGRWIVPIPVSVVAVGIEILWERKKRKNEAQ
jgi:hypothetical protein